MQRDEEKAELAHKTAELARVNDALVKSQMECVCKDAEHAQEVAVLKGRIAELVRLHAEPEFMGILNTLHEAAP